jgi:hypothetical protein
VQSWNFHLPLSQHQGRRALAAATAVPAAVKLGPLGAKRLPSSRIYLASTRDQGKHKTKLQTQTLERVQTIEFQIYHLQVKEVVTEIPPPNALKLTPHPRYRQLVDSRHKQGEGPPVSDAESA